MLFRFLIVVPRIIIIFIPFLALAVTVVDGSMKVRALLPGLRFIDNGDDSMTDRSAGLVRFREGGAVWVAWVVGLSVGGTGCSNREYPFRGVVHTGRSFDTRSEVNVEV